MRRFVFVAAVALMFTTLAKAAPAAPTTQPAQLREMAGAYTKLKSLSITGTLSIHADIGGKKLDKQTDFTASYGGGMRFHHEIAGDVVIAGTGEKLYVYLPSHNLYAQQTTAADGRFDDLPDDVRGLLLQQDPSLSMALSADPAGEFSGIGPASAAADVNIAGAACPAFAIAGDSNDLTVILDPATHLIRRMVVDESRGLKARGGGVKSAVVTIDYTQTTPNAAVTDAQFAFTPPPTAQEQQTQGAQALALVGKPVPHFSLTPLNGGENVSDVNLRGKVYVLDFWTTWCTWCAVSLPKLDEMYKQDSPAGLKVFAVNLAEDPAKVKEFISAHSLSLPVLSDSDESVGGAFGAETIPETVVVGRNGVVFKVFVGYSDEQEKSLSDAVHAALSAR